jgi:hypothetical protein
MGSTAWMNSDDISMNRLTKPNIQTVRGNCGIIMGYFLLVIADADKCTPKSENF